MNSRGLNYRQYYWLLGALSLLTPVLAFALPSDWQVQQGDVQFVVNGSTLNINSNSQNAVVNYGSFNVGHGETVNFNFLIAGSNILNQVIGQGASTIAGTINGLGGNIFLTNTAGIQFASTANVNVGSLIASSLPMLSSNFSTGQFTFEKNGVVGQVQNAGNIVAQNSIVLLGSAIENSGSLQAPNGAVHFAVGDKVTLGLGVNQSVEVTIDQALLDSIADVQHAIANSGSIEAHHVDLEAKLVQSIYNQVVNNSGVIRASAVSTEGGKIRLQGTSGDRSALVMNTGKLDASNADGLGGSIQVLGDKVALSGNALLDASGKTGGGAILVGGDYLGQNSAVYNASTTLVEAGTSLLAHATQSGQGGRIIIWSDEFTHVGGNIDVSGISQGGFVETSSKGFLDVQAAPHIQAANGLGGTWLLDPNNIQIVSGVGQFSTPSAGPFAGNTTFNTTNNTSRIQASLITTALASGNVSIVTGSSGSNSQLGDITISTALNYSGVGGRTLTFTAHRNITLSQTITSSNALNVIFNANGSGTFSNTSNGTINTAGGNLTVNANSINLNGDINTANGNVNLTSGSTISGTRPILTGTGQLNFSAPTSTNITYNVSDRDLIVNSATTPLLTLNVNGTNSDIVLNSSYSGNNLSLQSQGTNGNITVNGNINTTGTLDVRSSNSNVTINGNVTNSSTTGTTNYLAAGYNNPISSRNLTVTGSLDIAGGATKSLLIFDGEGDIFSKSYFSDNTARDFYTLNLQRGDDNGGLNFSAFTGLATPTNRLELVTKGSNSNIITNGFSGTDLVLGTFGSGSSIIINGNLDVTGQFNVRSAYGPVTVNGSITHSSPTGTFSLQAGYSSLNDLTVSGSLMITDGVSKSLEIDDSDGDIYTNSYFSGNFNKNFYSLNLRSGVATDFGTADTPWNMDVEFLYLRSLGSIYLNDLSGNLNISYPIVTKGNVWLSSVGNMNPNQITADNVTLAAANLTLSDTIFATDTLSLTGTTAINHTFGSLYGNQITYNTPVLNMSANAYVQANANGDMNLTDGNIQSGDTYIAGLPGIINLNVGAINNSGFMRAVGATGGSVTLNHSLINIDLSDVVIKVGTGGTGKIYQNNVLLFTNGQGNTANFETLDGAATGTGDINFLTTNGYHITANNTTFNTLGQINFNSSGNLTLNNTSYQNNSLLSLASVGNTLLSGEWDSSLEATSLNNGNFDITKLTGNLILGNVSTNGNVNLVSAGGIMQTGSLIANALSLSTVNGTATLTNTGNSVNTLTANSTGGSVSYTNAGALDVTSATVANTLTLATQGSGALTQSGAISANSLATTSNTGNITLTNTGNTLGGFTAASTSGNVSLVNNANTSISGITTTGNVSLSALAGFNLTQSTAIAANSLTLTTANGNATLNHSGNTVNTLYANSTGGNVGFTNSTNLALGSGAVANTLTLNTLGSGNLTQTAAIAANALSLSTANGTATLTNTGNSVNTLTANSTGGSVSYTNAGNLSVTSANVANTLTLATQGSGALTQSGAISANSLATTSNTGNITLANTGNAVGGFSATSTSGNVSLVNNANTSITGIITTGNVSLSALGGFNLTQTAAIAANALSLVTQSGSAILTHDGNAFNTLSANIQSGDIRLKNTVAADYQITTSPTSKVGLVSIEGQANLTLTGTTQIDLINTGTNKLTLNSLGSILDGNGSDINIIAGQGSVITTQGTLGTALDGIEIFLQDNATNLWITSLGVDSGISSNITINRRPSFLIQYSSLGIHKTISTLKEAAQKPADFPVGQTLPEFINASSVFDRRYNQFSFDALEKYRAKTNKVIDFAYRMSSDPEEEKFQALQE